jgi:hypothetical protein
MCVWGGAEVNEKLRVREWAELCGAECASSHYVCHIATPPLLLTSSIQLLVPPRTHAPTTSPHIV